MALEKKYWKSYQELEDKSLIEKAESIEFAQEIPVEDFFAKTEKLDESKISRRDFLKYLGFSTAAATLAACTPGVKNAIPYVVKPEEITPGNAIFYATSIYNGYDFASVLVKNREGRPIKIEPNKEVGDKGRTNARIQASILSLYDVERTKNPVLQGEETTWKTLNSTVKEKIKISKESGKKVVVLSNSVFSPSKNNIYKQIAEKNSNFSLVEVDNISSMSLLEATEKTFGVYELPNYNLDNTEVLISFGADFLNDWYADNLEIKYANNRKPENGKMLSHIQIESNLSLTGSNADHRIATTQADQDAALLELAGLVFDTTSEKSKVSNKISKIFKKALNSKTVVLSSSSDPKIQELALRITQKLNSDAIYFNGNKTKKAKLSNINQFVTDLKEEKIGVLILDQINPVYTFPNSLKINKLFKSVDFTVLIQNKANESTAVANAIAPNNHTLESWADYQPTNEHYFLAQPTISPLFNTKQTEESLLEWFDFEEKNYYNYLRAYTEANILKGLDTWSKALHDGYYKQNTGKVNAKFITKPVNEIFEGIVLNNNKGLELNLYTKVAVGDGSFTDNPWLMELPDPVTRTSWDNYITISNSQAKELGLENWYVSNGAMNGHLVNLKVGNTTLEKVPVLIQPGQATGTIGLSLGYGRKGAGKTSEGIGVNAYSLYNDFSLSQTNVQIEKVEGEYEFACIQLHHTMMGRDIVRETTLDEYLNAEKEVWNPKIELKTHKGKQGLKNIDLWTSYDYDSGHLFNMSIDLTTCSGCAACVVACHLENNVPVVGKEEIRKSRDMHWLRIDRYYSSDMTRERAHEEGLDKGLFNNLEMYEEMEVPSESPEVVFQPVMCQHCNHAPCETVCPVAATSHSKQGQNHMAYNRCVGTRYCLNNCPYKVRRFNWFKYFENSQFDYYMNNDLGRMVLNPDVVVRSRGVMEKCSLCIQKTQATILKSKNEGRKVNVNEFETACSSACATGAIQFGDVNNSEDYISDLKENDRKYYLLESVGTQPNVFYQVKVRNKIV